MYLCYVHKHCIHGHFHSTIHKNFSAKSTKNNINTCKEMAYTFLLNLVQLWLFCPQWTCRLVIGALTRSPFLGGNFNSTSCFNRLNMNGIGIWKRNVPFSLRYWFKIILNRSHYISQRVLVTFKWGCMIHYETASWWSIDKIFFCTI